MEQKKSILIVDNDPEVKQSLFNALSTNGNRIFLAESAEEAVRLFDQNLFDLVITDTHLPCRDGLQLLHIVKERFSKTAVIMMTRSGTIQNAVEAMRKGAYDYILKPFSFELMKESIRSALKRADDHHEYPPGSASPSNGFQPILTGDNRMREMLDLCLRVASTKATVLIQGESGTGKELFARTIHSHSTGREGSFVAVNCASLPETLFESELFGHEKGAFTGALNKKIGKFEIAHRGTILLDEISEMSLSLQAKILRVLQESEVDRIGGKDPIPIDVRVIATTNRNLEACVEKGEFRQDLYYRLNVISVKLPALRERVGDISLMASYFLGKFNDQYGKSIQSISEDGLAWLRKQEWRGNVRELKNVIERAVLTTSRSSLDVMDFCPEQEAKCAPRTHADSAPFLLRDVERNLIFRALEETSGNRTHAAKILGISIRTLRNKLNEYKQNLPPAEIV
ncbi:MAG TPA: sigma-54 dependent transcriptional regulator [Thermodesulfobacteriota bacterium]|nr:sigma-54 dependent transcriptional regulator [Thermodesulfobacteriota bacterium]